MTQPTLVEDLIRAASHAENCDDIDTATRLRAAAARLRAALERARAGDVKSGCQTLVLNILRDINGASHCDHARVIEVIDDTPGCASPVFYCWDCRRQVEGPATARINGGTPTSGRGEGE